ncbi:glycosyltransferase family 39 protein [Hymenobacter busanensis]|uniref:Glycosyltransferase family 39 protein n=1 Tax=Hymenobacter busanensis TaxID=2607656 RepID=A0A7L5A1V4_9BACT|nr:glycosyltransferase family 39 protein [Hymenobacter busanensis]KAA9327037.1 glycosyltransferase family 39 protein [Hymenobacter busanensis]QHJ09488.1 glycosyl transferase [Hymenobacter busanensis]
MKRAIPLLFLVLKFLTGYGLASRAYELHRDEYLYLEEGRHLAWGFLEVPPLTAVQAAITHALGGDWVWVKFWPLLWGALTVYVVVRLAQRLGAGWFGQALAGVCYLVAGYARLNFLFQPNSLEVLGFTLACYLLVREVQQPNARHWYALGAVLGLSLLNKYTTFFFIAALGVALLLSPLRRALATRHFWGGAALAALLFAPSLVWQLTHGIPFLRHMHKLQESQLVHVATADFWKDQLLMCFPAVWVWLPGLLALWLYRPLRPYRVLAWVWLAGLLILTGLHGKNYYALGYYPPLFAAGAAWWEALLRRWRFGLYLKPVLLAVPVLIILPLLPFVFTLYPPARMQELGKKYAGLGLMRWEDGQNHALPQDYADMVGWQEMADKTYQVYRALPDSTRARTLILCANYGQASAINYFNRHRAMPAAASTNGSYLFWFPPRQAFRQLILVDDEPDSLAAHFSSYRRMAEVQNPYARERGTRITLGLHPSRAILDTVYAEHRRELFSWTGQ